jgi:hypothetical protein
MASLPTPLVYAVLLGNFIGGRSPFENLQHPIGGITKMEGLGVAQAVMMKPSRSGGNRKTRRR